MPLSHLLDTSVYCQPLKPGPLPSVQTRWRRLADESIAISIVCEAELLYGLEFKQSRSLNAKYETLLRNRFAMLPVDAEVARCFAQIKAAAKRKGMPFPDFDFLIAATAKTHALILATLNYRHFTNIEGLAVEDWSKLL